MVAGRLRLRREDFTEPQYDLTRAFPDANEMYAINSILENCLVTRPEACLPSAADLLKVVDAAIAQIGQRVPVKRPGGKANSPVYCVRQGFLS